MDHEHPYPVRLKDNNMDVLVLILVELVITVQGFAAATMRGHRSWSIVGLTLMIALQL